MASSERTEDTSKRRPVSQLLGLPRYSTLKKSLSAPFSLNGEPQDELQFKAKAEEEEGVDPSEPGGFKRNGRVARSRTTTTGSDAIALQSLKWLPIPVLVLSSANTVILANDAMQRLVQKHPKEEYHTSDEEEDGSTHAGGLLGLNLSQIGVDMIQKDTRFAVNWHVRISHGSIV